MKRRVKTKRKGKARKEKQKKSGKENRERRPVV